MERDGKTRGRGRPRKTIQEMVNQPDVVHSPYPFKSTGGKRRRRLRKTPEKTENATADDTNTPYPFKSTGRERGRPRKTPPKPVNAIDDDTSPSFPENSRKRGRQITRADDDEFNSSSSKELSTDGQDSSDTTDEDYSPKTTGRNRGRPRTTPQQAANAVDDVSNPSFPETTGRKRGRPRKTPQQAVNAPDDDSNPSFPESSRKRGRQITWAEDDELNSSFSKEILTDGPSHHVQDSGLACNHHLPSNLVMSVAGENVILSHRAQDSGVAFNHPLPSNLVMCVAGENVNSSHVAEADEHYFSVSVEELLTDGPSHHVQDSGVPYNHPLPSNLVMSVAGENVISSHLVQYSGVACNHPLPSNLVTSVAGENVISSHHVQDSGVACDLPLSNNLVMSVAGENGNSSHVATPIDESKNPIQTEVSLCCPTKGKGVAAEPASETILLGNNVFGFLDEKDARATTWQSFNLTEVVDKIRNTLHDDDDDDDGEDIQSAIDPSLVEVKGYRVKLEIAPLLNEIFEQHGDIAKDCKVKGLQGCFLEKVCSVYEKLQNSSFQEIKRGELYEMGETLDGLEEMGLNVKWLSDRLYDILDVKAFHKLYDQKRKEFEKGNEQLIALEKAAAPIREKMSVLEKEISSMKGEEEKVQKALNLLNSSLVDGLI